MMKVRNKLNENTCYYSSRCFIIFVPLLRIGGMPLLILTLAMAVVAERDTTYEIVFVSAEALLSFVGVL